MAKKLTPEEKAAREAANDAARAQREAERIRVRDERRAAKLAAVQAEQALLAAESSKPPQPEYQAWDSLKTQVWIKLAEAGARVARRARVRLLTVKAARNALRSVHQLTREQCSEELYGDQ